MAIDLEDWEDEGELRCRRSVSRDLDDRHTNPARVGRAHQAQVNDQFDRVARSFRAVAGK